MTPDLREHAETTALAIEHGFTDPSVAIGWACALVAGQADSTEELIELAGAVRPHPTDVVGMLRRLPGASDPTRVFRKFLARLRDLLRVRPTEWPRVTRTLEAMAMNGEVPSPLDGVCHGLDDQRLFAEQNQYGSLEQAFSDLMAFLEMEGDGTQAAILAFATRFSDSAQPGWVECAFSDAEGTEHVFLEKVPIVTTETLNGESRYPRAITLGCEVTERSVLLNGRVCVVVDTSKPWGIESVAGITRFVIGRERLISDLAI